MDLDTILGSRGINLQTLQAKQAELEIELDSLGPGHSRRKNSVNQQLYRLEDFLYVNLQGKVELRKDRQKEFFWDPFKEREGIRLSPWERTGGWQYAGLYLGCQFYSLWIDLNQEFKSLVYLNKDEKTYHLFSGRKDSPLELVEQKLDTELSEKVLFELNDGDICTSRGVVLFGDNRDYANEIFMKVLQGEEILPKPKNGKSYTQRAKKGGKGDKIKPRTCGQIFLHGLNPSQIIQGQVFGSGASYKAYKFGDKVIVEADETGRATYLFTAQEFETLRHNSRSKILELRPKGFDGRVIHNTNGFEEWEKFVTEYLSR